MPYYGWSVGTQGAWGLAVFLLCSGGGNLADWGAVMGQLGRLGAIRPIKPIRGNQHREGRGIGNDGGELCGSERWRLGVEARAEREARWGGSGKTGGRSWSGV